MNRYLLKSNLLRQRGLTLVEMMVAMVIGLILISAVWQVFMTNKLTFTTQDQTAVVMESGNFAMGYLSRDLRMAGFAGCASRVMESGDVTSYLNSSDNIYDLFATGIFGSEASGTGPGVTYNLTATNPAVGGSYSPALANYTGVVTIPGSDVLKLSSMTDGAAVTGFKTGAIVDVDTVEDFHAGDIMVISDCSQATIFQATGVNGSSLNVGGSSGNSSGDPGNAEPISEQGPVSTYKTDSASISRLRSYVYFVGVGADGTPALFRAEFRDGEGTLTASEIISGVESMQLLFGMDADSDLEVDSYETASDVDAVTDGWQMVRAVRVGLLLRTPDNIRPDDDDGTYAVLGTTINPVDDRRQRRVLSTTVAMRNRLF